MSWELKKFPLETAVVSNGIFSTYENIYFHGARAETLTKMVSWSD
jgi:hypothetical protein